MTVDLEWLRDAVERGEIDTVVVAVTDMQGRLQGKRIHAKHFLEDVLTQGVDACDYLLAVDVEMNTVEGYAVSSWERGYGDFTMVPDPGTLRRIPWQPATVLVLCDLVHEDGRPIEVSPRQVLRRQLDRLAERGLEAKAATELEFLLFEDSYADAWDRRYQGLRPASRYNVDYSLTGTAPLEPVLRRIRNELAGAGLAVESSKGECNLGQQEIVFKYADALTTADNHVVYKAGAKEIAAQEDMSLTFMSKYDEREGNSCHIHLSLWSPDGVPALAGDGRHGFSPLMERSLAGHLAGLQDLMLLLAPNVNSYKRFVDGAFAPTRVAWGIDNRTCALRVVGHGPSLRVENRVPGGDVNPYLALAAVIATAIHGIDEEAVLEEPMSGNAYQAPKPRLPDSLHAAARRFEASTIAKVAFGQEVVDHYVRAADVEVSAFATAITDWERIRGFERL